MTTTTTYRKACSCEATATFGATRTRTRSGAGGSATVAGTFIPGPSCDGCGEPWIRDDGAATAVVLAAAAELRAQRELNQERSARAMQALSAAQLARERAVLALGSADVEKVFRAQLASMRAAVRSGAVDAGAAFDEGRWSRAHFDRAAAMHRAAGVRFDPDMADEISAVLLQLDAAREALRRWGSRFHHRDCPRAHPNFQAADLPRGTPGCPGCEVEQGLGMAVLEGVALGSAAPDASDDAASVASTDSTRARASLERDPLAGMTTHQLELFLEGQLDPDRVLLGRAEVERLTLLALARRGLAAMRAAGIVAERKGGADADVRGA